MAARCGPGAHLLGARSLLEEVQHTALAEAMPAACVHVCVCVCARLPQHVCKHVCARAGKHMIARVPNWLQHPCNHVQLKFIPVPTLYEAPAEERGARGCNLQTSNPAGQQQLVLQRCNFSWAVVRAAADQAALPAL